MNAQRPYGLTPSTMKRRPVELFSRSSDQQKRAPWGRLRSPPLLVRRWIPRLLWYRTGTRRLLPLRLCRGSISLFADVTLAVIKKILSCTSKKLNEQPADFLWLLLFNPVSGSVKKMDAAHLRTGGALHPLKRTGHLENAPVALAGNEE